MRHVIIDKSLTFYVNTHDGVAGVIDADSVPSYRIYEDETGTPILTGSMAKLDDTNTVGYYSEAIACSAANGFEVGKSYCIRILATIDSVDYVEVQYFDVIADTHATALAIKAKTDNLPTSPAAVGSEMSLADDAITATKITLAGAQAIADALLKRDVDQVEGAAAIHSLCSMVLKLVSKFDSVTGITYRTNGTTPHMTQAPTTATGLSQVRSLGVATS